MPDEQMMNGTMMIGMVGIMLLALVVLVLVVVQIVLQAKILQELRRLRSVGPNQTELRWSEEPNAGCRLG